MHQTAKSRFFFQILLLAVIAFFSGGTALAQKKAPVKLTPSEALEYMKKTPNLFMVDVSPPERFSTIHFTGALNIPYTELVSRINEIPGDRPLLLHCRLGKTTLNAYPLVNSLRPDIPGISYIIGKPLFVEYNDWKKMQK